MPRKGPSDSATLFPVGYKKKGNDGNMWEIIETRNGVQRWKRLTRKKPSKRKKRSKRSSRSKKRKTSRRARRTKRSTRRGCRTLPKKKRGPKRSIRRSESSQRFDDVPRNKTLKGKIYITHDNFSRPFLVEHNKNQVRVFKKSKEYNELDYDEQEELEKKVNPKKLYTDLIKEYRNVKNFFVGRDGSGYNMHGNSVLFELPGNRYIHVGNSVYEFNTDQPVEVFHSIMGNSNVPYPVALTKTDAYFMLDTVYVPRDEFDDSIYWNDAYSAFYGHSYWPEDTDMKFKTKGIHTKPLLTKKRFKNLKTVHKRIW